MNEDLTEQLYCNHPELFIRNGAYPISFDCGDGWFNIINQLCYALCEDRTQAARQLKYAIETKSTSRIAEYTNAVRVATEQLPSIIQIKEKFGELRVYVVGESESMSHKINFAERMASCTCELCGSPGRIRSGGWIQCRCDKCQETASISMR